MYECDLGEIILQIILEVDENILSLHRKIATGSVGRAVRQRSAKPCTAVRICWVPQQRASNYIVCSLSFYTSSPAQNTKQPKKQKQPASTKESGFANHRHYVIVKAALRF